jgi:hypothetical protein
MMEAVQTSETLANLHQSTRRYNPEESHLHYTFFSPNLYKKITLLLQTKQVSVAVTPYTCFQEVQHQPSGYSESLVLFSLSNGNPGYACLFVVYLRAANNSDYKTSDITMVSE